MTRGWMHPVIRYGVYIYFAAGMTLLLGDGMVWVVRQQANKAFAAFLLLSIFGGIFAVLALSSWDSFRRPLSVRRWILLCLLASIGIVELLLGTTSRGATGA
jgi:hypothetical protein